MSPPTLPPAPPIPTTDLLTFLFSEKPPNPDKPLFITADHPDLSYSWRQCVDVIRRLIAGLRAHPSFTPGGTVLIHSLNTALYPLLILAIVGAGGISAHTNPAYTAYELAHAVRITRVRLVLCEPEPESLNSMISAVQKAGLEPTASLLVLDVLPTQTVHPSIPSYRSLLNHGSQPWTTFSRPEQSQSTIAALFLSSGTTGLPKPVPLTHYNLIAQHALIYQPYSHLRDPNSPDCLPGYRHRDHHDGVGGVRILITLPMFHIGVSNLTFVTGVKENRTTILMRKFDPYHFLDLFERYGCNETVVVPPMVNAFVALAERERSSGLVERKFSTWRYGLVGAAPLGEVMQGKLRTLMNHGRGILGQLWGMTELSCIASFIPPNPDVLRDWRPEQYEGSVGWTASGCEMKVFDPETLKEVAEGSEGEIWVRAPTAMLGYFGEENQTINQTAFVDDPDGKGKWLRSGDLGKKDPETGLWWIVGRVKELIKVKGFQVSPSELEDVIRGLDGVADVAVVGVDAPRKGDGEVPRAFVTRMPGSKGDSLKEKDIKEWVQQRLSRFKWLEGGVVFVDTVPRNASGKILRRVLKEMVKEDSKVGLSKL